MNQQAKREGTTDGLMGSRSVVSECEAMMVDSSVTWPR